MQIAKWLQNCLVTSLMHAPAVVLMDDVDALIPVIPEHAPPQEQHMIEFFNEFLASVFDWMREKARPPPRLPTRGAVHAVHPAPLLGAPSMPTESPHPCVYPSMYDQHALVMQLDWPSAQRCCGGALIVNPADGFSA